ncbi:PREDICTED: IgGFc-binding protein [Colobus angolensis palliatus]|uniref:IgGFc-binding protein n=1 Tax=Colobus angolensis palliatus TaxID=336983 RepID=UPI0005F3AA6F|nr:PREDICTED: IgGFc-binding protein [Colobus angolensis palliatus]
MGALWSWWILWAGATFLWGMTQEASVDLKNTGRNEFLTAFLQNYQLAYSKAYPCLLISSLSESPASVFILSQADKTSKNVTVRPGESVMVNISANAEMIGSKIFQHAVVIHSDHAISVQALNAKPDTAELTLLRPIQALGTEYFVLTPPGTSARNVKEFAVVAGAAGASVSVTLKGSVTFNGKFYPAGDVLSVTLEPYNVAQLQSSVDLSGSKVTASSPVAVLSGHSCAQKHTTCNHVVEQLLPTSAWGTHYVVPPLASQSRYDLAFVVASQATQLTYNHGGITGSRGLQAGDVVEFEVRPSRPLYLSANVGIQVLLFGTGAIRNEVTYDPYLVLIPDVAAYCPAYVFKSVPGSEGVALVVAQTKAISGLTIDGHAVGANLTWAAVPGSEFSYAEVELGTADTIHTAEATTNFGLLTFGLAKATGYATAADCGRTVVSPAKPSCEGVQCAAGQRCQVVDGKAKCVAESTAVCRAQGDPHYTTFDGRRYDMMGTCSYTMAELCSEDDTLPAFSVEAKNEHRGSRRVSYVGLVTVHAYSHSVSLTRGEVGFVLVDKQRSRLPVSLSEGRLRVYQSGLRAVVELVFGLVVTYDWDCQLALSLPARFQDQVCGLCGNYNGDPADDFLAPDGDLAPDAVEFASSWKLDDGDYLCEDGCQNNCPSCTPGQAQHYEGDRLCGMLTQLDGPFAVCHDTLDPRPFLEQCVYDLCVVGGERLSLCRGLSAYAQACLELGISVGNWRPPANCPLSCPANSSYELCSPACPASCNEAAAPSNCSGRPCVEGCVCLPGFVASGGACVPTSSCGCTFQGLQLAPGQEVWADESCQRRCTCNGATHQVTCRDTQGCPAGEICSDQNGLLGCYPNRFGTCQGSGDPHYVSFDGRRFDFMGTCTYLLVGSCGQNAALPAFRVLVENEHRGSQTVSYTRAVLVEARGVKVAVRREYPGQVLVDDVLQYLPFQAADGQVQVFRQGRDAVVRTDFGLTVTYNWDAQVTAKVPSSYAEALCGLCGNFNGDPADDLALRGGGQAANALAFGNSWQEETRSGCGATEPGDCPKLDSLVAQQLQSKNECGILADPSGPFRECHSKLDPQGAVRDCVYDRCLLPGQSGPLCDALATYAAACQAAGATVHPWRSENLCPLSCPPHSHYEACSYGCPLSCGDLPVRGGCGSECHEGCVCDEGFALSGESCLPLASCGCVHQGTYHPPGQTFYPGPGCDSLCHCQEGGLVSCEPSSCGPHEACQPSGGSLGCVAVGSATCQASGDPHYTTFDGRRFDFMGTCVYVLAQTCGTRPGLHRFAVLQENVAWGNGRVSVTRVITVQVANFTLRLEQEQWKVTVNGVDMKLPVVLANGQIRASQHGSDVVIETDFGLRVAYDLVYYVRVTIPGNYYQLMCGLCGNYNGDPKDDFQKPNGSQAGNANEFGNSWEEVVPGSPCLPPPTCPPGSEGCDTSTECPPEQETKYQKEEFCGLLSSATGPLASCHKLVDPQGPLQDCVFDLCLGGGNLSILCSNIHAYVSACQAAGGHVKPWRTETFCPVKCPANSHYELCADTCSLGCSALSAPLQCPDGCAEGCQCDAGFLYNGEACVPIQQCGCYHNGVYYEPEQTVLIDDCQQQCTCHAGKDVLCQEHSCKPGQVCQPSEGILKCVTKDPCNGVTCRPQETCKEQGGQGVCVPNYEATCWLWGDPHYHSFDGRPFDFQGTCNYVLATTGCPGANTQGLTPFTVTTKNENRGNPAVSYVRVVTVAALGTNISIHKGEVGKVRYFQGCLLDACQVQGHPGGLCPAVAAYVAACQAAGAQLGEWRRPDFCHPDSNAYMAHAHLVPTAFRCPAHSHYKLCGDSCPVSCPSLSAPEGCESACREGCVCDAGFVLSGDTCVPVGQCGCLHDDRYYPLGQTFYPGPGCDSLCHCREGGLVSCQPSSCGPHETCRPSGGSLGCVAVGSATCQASGDPHYTTFDGRRFDFMGTCVYVLAQTCGTRPGLHRFAVLQENVAWGNGRVSVTRVITVQVANFTLRLEQEQWKVTVRADGKQGARGLWPEQTVLIDDCRQQCTCHVRKGVVCQEHSCTPGQVCQPSEGVLRCITKDPCDGVTCRPQETCKEQGGQGVCVPNYEATCWLWGDPHYHSFDGRPFDFQGTCNYVLATTGCPGANTQGLTPFTVTTKNENRGNPAVSYVRVVTVAALGTNISIHKGEVGKVRNSHYEVCGPPCPASCPSPAPPATPAACEGPCVEGCQCDAGFVLSADRCVPLNNGCGCWANGTYHEAGSEFWADGTCSHRCRCGPGGGSLVCTPASCGLGEVCGLLPSGQHGCQPVSTAECQAWGDPHYVTLDGHRFDFQGNCEYLLSAPCHGPPSGAANFTVTVANEHRGSQAVSYTRSVTLQIYNHSLTLSARWPRRLQVDGVFVALPFHLDSLLHAHLSGADVVVTTTSGLSLTFDGDSFVRLRVPAAYAGALCGLCGNYNQDPADDLKAVDGKPAGWQVGGAQGCGECASGPCPSQCTPEQQESFAGPDACGVISATDGPLASCRCLVPPSQYFQGCLLDACQVQGHPGGLCPAVAAYVAACQAAGAQLGEWRRPDFCPFQCPAHSHYELCGDSCPVSCPSLSAPEGCESACREGCVCDAGYVLSGDTCVPVGQCGCLYDGRYYPLGEAFYPGPECERRCECGPGGHVTCQGGAACGPHEECRLEDGVQACHATGCGRCLANGGIHYVTLDGRVFDLHGSCSYVLAQVCQPKPGDEDFSIVLEKNAAGDPQRLLVTVSGQVVSLAQGQQVTVDGEAVALPVAVGRVRVTAEGRNMVLQTTKGLRLLFDGDAHVLMSIPSSFRGRLCGLCGNFNGNWSDDFVLPNGLAASSVETFGAAWRAPGSSKGCGEGCGPQGCPVCSAEETAPYESNKACGQLRNPQGPFATCQAVLSPSEYFRQCVYDLCAQKGDTAFLCRSLAAYTAACQAAGLAVKPWRTESFCPLQCPAHSHYSICTHTCQGSCAALSGLTGCTTRCFEGCECDDRFLLSQGVCIPVQDCGCTHNGRYLPVNSSLLTSDCSKRCSCSSSSGLTCQAAGCPSGRVCEVKAEARDCWAARGLCVLSMGANLTTFDGARGATTSPGVYELSYRCPGLQKTIPWYRVVAEVQTCHGKTEAVGQIHIFFEDGMVTVTPNKGVWVNGLRVDLPAEKLASVSVSRTTDGSLLVHQKAGVQVWLGANGKLAVMVSDDHAGKLCGACGNFDGDQTNDWRDSEKSVMEKWRAQDFSPCYG